MPETGNALLKSPGPVAVSLAVVNAHHAPSSASRSAPLAPCAVTCHQYVRPGCAPASARLVPVASALFITSHSPGCVPTQTV